MATGLPKTKWNGKGGKGSEDNNHKSKVEVNLLYEGKRSEDEILKTSPAEVKVLLEERLNQRRETGNRLYYGNNLPILASLLKDQAIKGNVKLVYIDPPFSTKSVFQSRSQKDAYCDLLSGAPFIEFIRERAIILRELLATDGSFYIHLDDNMAFHIKVILDEIFGRNNFRNWVTRKKCNNKNYTRNSYGNISDYILFYTKSNDYVWNRPMDIWTDERAKKEYQYIEKGTNRRFKKVPIHAPGQRNGETGKSWRGMLPPPGKHWQFKPKTLEEMDLRGEIYWSPNGNPRRKIYLDESNGISVQDIWLNYLDAYNQNVRITGYPTEKNPDMIDRIIEASSNPGDLVLDCFSGSGTTLVEASSLKRYWIGIDNSLEAIKTTLYRFAKGTDRMGDFVINKFNDKSKNLTLFQPDDKHQGVIEKINDKNRLRNIIKDFTLFSSEEIDTKLLDIIKQWNSWQ